MPRMLLTLVIITGNSGKVSGLLTVSIDALYNNLKAMTKPVDIKHSKAALDDIEVTLIILFNDYSVTLYLFYKTFIYNLRGAKVC